LGSGRQNWRTHTALLQIVKTGGKIVFFVCFLFAWQRKQLQISPLAARGLYRPRLQEEREIDEIVDEIAPGHTGAN